MTPMHSTARLVLVATLMVAATMNGSCASTRLVKEQRTLNTPHVPGTAVRIQTENGSISVKAADRQDVQVVAQIRATTSERLQATRVNVRRDQDQVLVVDVTWPDGKRKNNEGCGFEVLIPDAKGVALRSSNGALEIHGLGGRADLATSNGAIKVQGHAGPLVAQSSNGAITATDVTGAVKVETTNGRIHVVLADEAPGPLEARTSNGAIDLALGAAFQGELTLRTSNGALDIRGLPGAKVKSLNKTEAHLILSEGGAPSTARTSNGAITVHAR